MHASEYEPIIQSTRQYDYLIPIPFNIESLLNISSIFWNLHKLSPSASRSSQKYTYLHSILSNFPFSLCGMILFHLDTFLQTSNHNHHDKSSHDSNPMTEKKHNNIELFWIVKKDTDIDIGILHQIQATTFSEISKLYSLIEGVLLFEERPGDHSI